MAGSSEQCRYEDRSEEAVIPDRTDDHDDSIDMREESECILESEIAPSPDSEVVLV